LLFEEASCHQFALYQIRKEASQTYSAEASATNAALTPVQGKQKRLFGEGQFIAHFNKAFPSCPHRTSGKHGTRTYFDEASAMMCSSSAEAFPRALIPKIDIFR
jgi:hypothetical protein